MTAIHLGVNVDHVATLRQARGTDYPDPVKAALMSDLLRSSFLNAMAGKRPRRTEKRAGS